MSKLDLRVRDLTTGVASLKSFESEAAAQSWLSSRPRGIEVLGVATIGLDPEVNATLKASVRPLDDHERELERKLETATAAAAQERQEKQAKAEQAAAEAHRAAMKTADPNRLMEVHWRYDRDMELTDRADDRPITDEAREAVVAWVRERDEWVKDRNQVVGDAKVMVYPGPVPGGSERVKRGTFIPVTAPEKKES
jgi:hypothetical protein